MYWVCDFFPNICSDINNTLMVTQDFLYFYVLIKAARLFAPSIFIQLVLGCFKCCSPIKILSIIIMTLYFDLLSMWFILDISLASFPGSSGVLTNVHLNLHSLKLLSWVQLLSHVWLFATPWVATHQASLSITNFQTLLKLMSIPSVTPSNHFIFCCPLLLPPLIFPASGSFPTCWFITSGGQSTGASSSASVLPMNIQDWFPLGMTGLISLQSKGLSRVFFNTIVQKHQFFGAQLSL